MKMRRQLWVEVPDEFDDIVLEHPSGEVQQVEVEHGEQDADQDDVEDNG